MQAPDPIAIPVRHFMLDPQSRAHVGKLIRMADARFRLSAKAWEQGNNSGDPRELERCTERERRLADEGAAMLAPLGIKCDWPGLYPSFAVRGAHEYTTANAVLVALGHPRNWMNGGGA